MPCSDHFSSRLSALSRMRGRGSVSRLRFCDYSLYGQQGADHGLRTGLHWLVSGLILLVTFLGAKSQAKVQAPAPDFTGPIRTHWKDFVIEDAVKDIEELDVGDVNDDVNELPPDFPESVEREKPLEINMQDEDDWGQSPNIHFGHRLLIVNLRVDGEYEPYADPDFTGAVLRKWAAMLKNADVDARIYSIESARAVINIRHVSHIGVVRRFLVQQPDVDYWEIDGQRFFPPGRTKPYSNETERARKIKAMHEGDPFFQKQQQNRKGEEL